MKLKIKKKLKIKVLALIALIFLLACDGQQGQQQSGGRGGKKETPILSKTCGLHGCNRDRKPGSTYCKKHSEEIGENR